MEQPHKKSIMEVVDEVGPRKIAELRDEAYKAARRAGAAAFAASDLTTALEKYEYCLAVLKASDIPRQRPTDDGLTHRLLGAEMARLGANMSMLHLRLGHDPEIAVALALEAVSNCPSWPKAHGRHGEALSAAGRHEAAAEAFARAARQTRAAADSRKWTALESTARELASETAAAARAREAAATRREAEESFDSFFAHALKISALTETEFQDVLKRQDASKADLVLEWRDRVQRKSAQRNAGPFFAALDVATIETYVLERLAPKDLARHEQTCRFFAGVFDVKAKERLRRVTRCARLLRTASTSSPATTKLVRNRIEEYCSSWHDKPLLALERLVRSCVPALLDEGKKAFQTEGRYFNVGAFTYLVQGLSFDHADMLWRTFFRARASWLKTLRRERDEFDGEYGVNGMIPRANYRAVLLAALSLSRREEDALSGADVRTVLNHVSEISQDSLDADDDAPEDDAATYEEWIAFYDKRRELAGVDVEVLLTLDHIHRRQGNYSYEHSATCCNIVHNIFRSSSSAIGMHKLAEPLGRHLMAFMAIFNTGPDKFPNASPPTALALARVFKSHPSFLSSWQSMLRSAADWLKESYRLGYALHLRAHQILNNPAAPPAELDVFSFQAHLLTQNLVLGTSVLLRRFETADSLGAFFAEFLAMVEAYRGAVPLVERWIQRTFVTHKYRQANPYPT